MLPEHTTDARSDETALAVAAGGVICPVPFVMPAVAMRIASHRSSRLARAAYWLAAVTIVAQAAGIAVLLYVLLG